MSFARRPDAVFLAVIVLALACSAGAAAQAPQLNLGLSSAARTDQTRFSAAAGIEAGLDYRAAVSDWGRLLLQGTGNLGRFLDSDAFADAEAAKAVFGLRSGEFELEAEGSFKGSAAGSIDASAYYRPGWAARLELKPFSIGYSGEVLADLAGSDDLIAHGARFGLVFSPDPAADLELGLNARWERWSEQYIYPTSAAAGGEQRQDLLFFLDQSISAFVDYFATIDLEGRQGYRASTANRVLGGTLVEAGSESGWYAGLAASFSASPGRRLSLRLKLGAAGMIYDKRSASSGGAAWTLTPAAGFFADFTPDGRLFVSASVDADGTLSNEAEFRAWKTLYSIALSYAF